MLKGSVLLYEWQDCNKLGKKKSLGGLKNENENMLVVPLAIFSKRLSI